MDDLERQRGENFERAATVYLRQCPGIRLEGLRKTAKTLCQNSLLPS